jgi:hypothetical protein
VGLHSRDTRHLTRGSGCGSRYGGRGHEAVPSRR